MCQHCRNVTSLQDHIVRSLKLNDNPSNPYYPYLAGPAGIEPTPSGSKPEILSIELRTDWSEIGESNS